ncbi:hypothetical protein Pint_30739 [Pistacia integerrima]|uniref:Uncharacterized protein n=1 Tax=Pistacia integerrima TaxID=434235 RepID=A0ACC0X2V9_9ROSI|nr:hypothetical protein Pint_30739 [Pistacia integerrima]
MNTERRNRRRRIRDVELGYSSSDESGFSSECRHFRSSRKCYRERKQWHGNGSRRHHHHVKPKSKGGSRRLRNSRQCQIFKVRNPRKNF